MCSTSSPVSFSASKGIVALFSPRRILKEEQEKYLLENMIIFAVNIQWANEIVLGISKRAGDLVCSFPYTRRWVSAEMNGAIGIHVI